MGGHTHNWVRLGVHPWEVLGGHSGAVQLLQAPFSCRSVMGGMSVESPQSLGLGNGGPREFGGVLEVYEGAGRGQLRVLEQSWLF